MTILRHRIFWLPILLAAASLASCGNSNNSSGPAAAEPADGAAAEAPVAAQPPRSQWPDLTDEEKSTLSTGIIAKVLDQLPPALLVQDQMIQSGETADIVVTLGRGFGSTTITTYADQPLVATDARGETVLRARTDKDGRISFRRRFPEPGDYFYRVAAEAPVDEKTVQGVLFGIYVRPKDAPLVICDMDKTLVKSGFAQVLMGMAEPFEGAAAVLDRLVADRKATIVYLTHRHNFLDTESRTWLRKNDFPPGPLVDSDLSGLLAGSEKFKTGALAEFKKRYPNVVVAIGDKIADSNAYVANDVPSILLMDIEWDKTKLGYWADRMADLRGVDDHVTVCRDWAEIEKALFDDAQYPPQRMRDLVQQKLNSL